jgi:DNA-binding CsgD family transcriptional regulator
LDCVLPQLQMAVRIARRVLDAEAAGAARVLQGRGPVFALDSWGRVLRVPPEGTEDLGITVQDKRIRAIERPRQTVLDRAIAAAVSNPQRPAVVAVANERGERRFLHILPVSGRARDVFLATAAVVVAVPGHVNPLPGALRQLFGLTEREAQIAALLAEGSSLSTIAERLHLGLGTVRNHMKIIFGKTSTGRQGELVALLCSLQL